MRPAAVLFDMDGTLVDSEKVWTVSLVDTARWLGGEMSDAAREEMIGSDMSGTLRILFEDLGLPDEPQRRGDAVRHLNECTAKLFAEGLQWRPGAREALQMVRAAGWRSALVTNTERALTEAALDGIGREHFDVTVCSDEVAAGKPAPDPYLRAAELLGVAAGDCLAVEDSPTGTLAAERAGAGVLVVPCDTTVEPGPGRVLRSSLVGLTVEEIREVSARISARTAGPVRPAG